MEWVKNLLDEFEKKEADKQKQLEDERKEHEARDRRIQEQWEALVEKEFHPYLRQIERVVKEKNYPARIIRTSGASISGKTKLMKIGLEVGSQKIKTASPRTKGDHAIIFSRKPFDDKIEIDYSRPETTPVRKILISPKTLKVEEISKEVLEKEMKDFLSGIFFFKE